MTSIVIAPFSNGDIRDWQPGHFSTLIGLLLDRWDGLIRVIGTRSQATRAAAIVRPYDATRVISECGRLAWEEVMTEMRRAACVIGNNSGVTHVSGWLGVPTICIFGGSHQRLEWHPSGLGVRTISRAIGCAPCLLHRTSQCPYDKACLSQIAPETVADAAFAAMGDRIKRETHNGA
ncbi:MAG TPA: glycosyltransferase family 9 protein [Sphingomonas sp.]|nr:glycosyltransferase family 9 protein [Sphingomonas sp.]